MAAVHCLATPTPTSRLQKDVQHTHECLLLHQVLVQQYPAAALYVQRLRCVTTTHEHWKIPAAHAGILIGRLSSSVVPLSR